MADKIIYLDGEFYRDSARPEFLTLGYFIFTHTMHYCGCAFEGGRGYPNEKKKDGTVNMIGIDLRVSRLFRSVESIWIKRPSNADGIWLKFKRDYPLLAEKYREWFENTSKRVVRENILEFAFTNEEVRKAIIDTFLLNVYSKAIEPEKGGYWRPLAWVGKRDDHSLGVFSMLHPKHFMIAVVPWGKYIGELEFTKGATVMISDVGIDEDGRHNKLGANYSSGQKMKNTAMYNMFNEMLLTDKTPERNLLEGTGENLIFYLGRNTFISPKQEGKSILPGTTLKVIDRMIRLLGGEVIYKDIPLDTLWRKGYITGGAMLGTAAEVTPISLIYDQKTGKVLELKVPPEIRTLQQSYLDMVKGLDVDSRLKELQNELITEIKWDDKKHSELAKRING